MYTYTSIECACVFLRNALHVNTYRHVHVVSVDRSKLKALQLLTIRRNTLILLLFLNVDLHVHVFLEIMEIVAGVVLQLVSYSSYMYMCV